MGTLVIAWHVTIPPAWLDPAEAPPPVGTFELSYARHDALVRPLPGERRGHSLAVSWTGSPDGLVSEFTLCEGWRFHNGDPCTGENVKCSSERYRGVGAKPLHAHGHAGEVVDALRVRFHLQAPWPDFLPFHGTTRLGRRVRAAQTRSGAGGAGRVHTPSHRSWPVHVCAVYGRG
jgi:peptide/nickel transport system substrate-binding protein